MAQRLRLSLLVVFASALLVPGLRPVQFYAQAPAPTRILVCESPDDSCKRPDAHLDLVWILNGVEGTVSSPSGASGSRITIEKFDSESIVVRRVDQSGLTALYAGTVHGANMSGTVLWSWPDHQGYPANGTFSAVLQDQLAAEAQSSTPHGVPSNVLPSELLVCENNGPCNAAWILHGSEGTATWFGRNPARAKLTVLRSAPDDILIRRTDTTDSVSATYAGSLRGDHYSGTIVWNTPGHPGEATGTWTATVPQTSCDSQAALESPDAVRLGQNALMFHRDREALGCYIVAAKAGDATAQVAVGLIYYQGRGTIPQDYTQAFFWLHKAADQGVYAAQRTVAEMYSAGQGTPRDPKDLRRTKSALRVLRLRHVFALGQSPLAGTRRASFICIDNGQHAHPLLLHNGFTCRRIVQSYTHFANDLKLVSCFYSRILSLIDIRAAIGDSCYQRKRHLWPRCIRHRACKLSGQLTSNRIACLGPLVVHNHFWVAAARLLLRRYPDRSELEARTRRHFRN